MDKTAELTIARSCDLDFNLVLRVSSYSGPRIRKPLTSILGTPEMHAGWAQATPSDLYVQLQLWSDNKPLSVPFQTAHKSFKPSVYTANQDAITSFAWNQAITLPIKYKDLPLNAQITFTVYDTKGPPAATSAVPVGGATLKLFGKKATVKRGKQRLHLWPGKEADGCSDTTTPSKVVLEPGQQDEMGRLEKLVKKHQSGDIPRIDWLDKLAFRKIEQVHTAEAAKSTEHFLYVDLPNFDFPVVFGETEYALPTLPALTASTSNAGTPQTPAFPIASTSSSASEAALFSVIDPDIIRENIVEAKHRRLVRGHRSGPLDRELKPNAKIRDELNEILQYPPLQPLTAAQRDLMWRFRFYLSRDKRALTKFLKSVVWSDPGEVKQAVEELLPSWTDIEMQDALELLGPGEAFRDRRVKAYAVKQISRVDDDELMLYLLQLVQALKFDSPDSGGSRRRRTVQQPNSSSSRQSMQQSLEDFLVHRSVRNPILGNHFYWYLMCEVEDEVAGKLFKKVAFHFMTSIEKTPNGRARRDEIRRQAEFVTALSKLAREVRGSKDSRPKKIDKMRAVLHDSRSGLSSFAAIPLPLDAHISVTGIDADNSTIFKSNLFPLRLSLKTQQPENAQEADHFTIIFKNGDDLRQDQLVIQLFTLMDRLLRNENLDLRMMPYRVLATTPVEGMVQFVPSSTIGAIVNEYGGSLLAYLRQHHPDEGSVGTYGVSPDVLDTYIRSCAGYCVFTYLLGVGDRHLDNLLLTPDGHFFHVDFGYILGRDPKPYPPAVKLSKEMVDAMGGMQSPHYNRFKKFCFTAFTILRKSANLLVNLIALMVDASIPDIKFEPDKAVMKVQDKFRLDLSEEEAIKHLEGILNETSTWAAVLDRLHNAAQALRA